MSRDAGDDFERELRSVFRPESRLGVVDWLSSREGILDVPYSPKRGRLSLEATPWLKEPLESVFDPLVELTVLVKPIQTGGSLVLEAAVPYIAARSPGAAVVYAPTRDKAKLLAETRLRPLLESCAATARVLPPKREFQWDSFPVDRAHFFIRGADNLRDLQSITTKFVLGTEVYLWKRGHLAEARKRSAAFKWAGKQFFESQAGLVGDDLDNLFAITDRREWSFECPDCRRLQPWEFRNLKFPEGAVTPDGFDFRLLASGVKLCCVGCGSPFDDSEKSRALLNSRSTYVPTNFNASPRNRGFHYPSLVARGWGGIAEEWGRARLAMNSGNDDPMRIFKQKEEAVPWTPTALDTSTEIPPSPYRREDEWEDEGGFDNRTRRIVERFDKSAPGLSPLRFLSVDVQRDRLVCLLRSWSSDGRSRLRDWTTLTTFEELEEYRRKMSVLAPFLFIDCGDQFDTVTRTAARFGWNASRGDRRTEFPWRVRLASGKVVTRFRPFARPRVVEAGRVSCRVHHFGNLPLKDLLFRLRRSGVHQYPLDAGEDYVAQMQSERRVLNSSGLPEWKLIGKRANHLFDCEVIQLVPALALGLVGRETRAKSEPEEPGEPAGEGESEGG